MVVGSTTIAPGETGTLRASVIMHEGMGGPHLFHVFVRSSDPEKPVTMLKVEADIVGLEKWKHSHPNAFYLPRELTDFKLFSEIEGIIAEDQAYEIFGLDEPMENAYLGRYRNGKRETSLLVAEYGDVKKAEEIFSKFIGRMRIDGATANVFRRIEIAHKDVYSLMERRREHYYFQNTHQVVRLSPDVSVGKRCLLEVLKFFDML